MDLKLYLALAGGLGLAYVTYSVLNKPRTFLISKDLTQRISQQIKHQIMILCISFSKAAKQIKESKADQLKGADKLEEIFSRLRSELSQVYVAKENLILKKYAVSRETYGKSLQKWKHDKKIVKNTEEIIHMMQRAISGQTPDFTVPQAVYQSFTREQLAEIYKQMVSLIGKKVTNKLQHAVLTNKNFNPNSDDDFRNAIRELQIYDVKVEFLKGQGFKEEWGCPNEVFFKYLEHEKTKDETYEKKIVAYEKCYEKIIEMVSVDPNAISDAKIDEMFAKALAVPSPAPVAPVVAPVRVAPVVTPVVEAPKPFVPPARAQKKPEPVDEESYLQEMMMQQLMSRSQQSVGTSLQESRKIGLTSSQIQEDWQAHGSIHEKEPTKLEEATEEVAIGHEDKNLLKAEMNVVEQALRDIESREEADKVEEPVVIDEVPAVQAPIIDVEPVEEEPVEEPVSAVQEPIVFIEETVIIIEEPVADVEEQVADAEEQAVDAEEQVAEEPVVVIEETVVIIEEPQGETVVIDVVEVKVEESSVEFSALEESEQVVAEEVPVEEVPIEQAAQVQSQESQPEVEDNQPVIEQSEERQ